MSLSSACLLPLLHTADVPGQPRRAYCKFLELEPQLAIGASLLQDRHCGTVLLVVSRGRTVAASHVVLALAVFTFLSGCCSVWRNSFGRFDASCSLLSNGYCLMLKISMFTEFSTNQLSNISAGARKYRPPCLLFTVVIHCSPAGM